MKFDMHVENIKNIKFNGQIFKIYLQKEIYEKLVWRKTLFLQILYVVVITVASLISHTHQL